MYIYYFIQSKCNSNKFDKYFKLFDNSIIPKYPILFHNIIIFILFKSNSIKLGIYLKFLDKLIIPLFPILFS